MAHAFCEVTLQSLAVDAVRIAAGIILASIILGLWHRVVK